MMLIAIILAISVALNVALVRLFMRGAQRLMQYDDILQEILPILEDYGADLTEMSSGNLTGALVDHPEILAFHKRNIAARHAVESIVDSVTRMTPERKKTPVLPRPDME